MCFVTRRISLVYFSRRFHPNSLLLPQSSSRICPPQPNARLLSTAAVATADSQDVQDIPEQDPRWGNRTEQRENKKRERRRHRAWMPPFTAEVGVTSLGQPTEILVLEPRDGFVPNRTEFQSRRSGATEPKILNTLATEKSMLLFEDIKKSLDQLGEPYINRSSELSKREWVDLEREVMNGYTQRQLRSYCLGKNREHPVQGTNMGKAQLFLYLVTQKWAFNGCGNLRIECHCPIPSQQLDYIATFKQAFLQEQAGKSSVIVGESEDHKGITIKGQRYQVLPLHDAIQQLCKDLQVSRLRTSLIGERLKNRVATSDFIDHLTRKHRVMISWASSHYEGILEHEDWLSVCFHKIQDMQSVLNVEREILLAERKVLRIADTNAPKKRNSLWFPSSAEIHQLASHEVSLQPPWTSSSIGLRWALPHRPLDMGKLDPTLRPHIRQNNSYIKSINQQSAAILQSLPETLDEFFLQVPSRRYPLVTKGTNQENVDEELAVNFCRVLYPSVEPRHLSCFPAFRATDPEAKGQLVVGETATLSAVPADLPGLPNYLRSLSSFDDGRGAERCIRHRRVRYVPLASNLPPGVDISPVEVDLAESGKPGFPIMNQVKDIWIVLDEHSHDILLPAFTLDLNLVRRLRYRVMHYSDPRATKLTKDIMMMNWDQIPNFIDIDLPKVTFKHSHHSPRTNRKLNAQATHLDLKIEESAQDSALASESGELSKQMRNKRKKSPTKMTYMLESSELISSTRYQKGPLCLEHLHVEDRDEVQARELLRLSGSPLFGNMVHKGGLKPLLERAFTIAAQLGDPCAVANQSHVASLRAAEHGSSASQDVLPSNSPKSQDREVIV